MSDKNGLRSLIKEAEQAPNKIGEKVQSALEGAVLAHLEEDQLEKLTPGEVLKLNKESGFGACTNARDLLVLLSVVETTKDFVGLRAYILFGLHHSNWTIRRAALNAVRDHIKCVTDVVLWVHAGALEEDDHDLVNRVARELP